MYKQAHFLQVMFIMFMRIPYFKVPDWLWGKFKWTIIGALVQNRPKYINKQASKQKRTTHTKPVDPDNFQHTGVGGVAIHSLSLSPYQSAPMSLRHHHISARGLVALVVKSANVTSANDFLRSRPIRSHANIFKFKRPRLEQHCESFGCRE